MAKIDHLMLCSCENSMSLDPESARNAAGADKVSTASELCMGEIDTVAKALTAGGSTLIACGQMINLFEDLFDEVEAKSTLDFADIRDRAGWTSESHAHAKQAALLADAVLERPATPVRDILSEGTVMVLGGETALQAGRALADQLAVTVLLQHNPGDLVPDAGLDIALGQMRQAHGALGGFDVVVDDYAALKPGGRGPGQFGAAVNGAKSSCDIILDLRGEAPLFPAPK